MKIPKSRSELTKSQQNGIFLFIGIIIFSLVGKIYFETIAPNFNEKHSIVDKLLQKKLDSLKLLKSTEKKTYVTKIYPFNPNFLKEGKAYRLGLSAEEHDRLLSYRNQDKWINTAEDFKKVTGISNELLAKISPYFKFPEWVIEQQKQNPSKKAETILSFEQKLDLNTVSAKDLQKISGIGEVIAQRIIRYRDKIGGFRDDIQLKDIYGLKPDVTSRLIENITVKSNLNQPIIDINSATLLDLTEVPYFDYELAREIFQFIKVNDGIDSFEILSKLQQFPNYKIDRIKLYLKIIK